MTTDSNKALLQVALDQSAAVLRDAGPADPELLAEVFEAIGRLLAAGASADELHARGRWSVERALIDAALAREPIADALESEAFALLEALHTEPHDSEEPPDPSMLLSRFTVRDQAELELLGAAFVAGCAPAAVTAGASARLAFDLAVRPHAFKLVAHNVERAERSRWIHPQHRERFWWWFEGLSLDPRAASAMSAVASLVARSADAREHFHRLVRAEESWAALGAARRGGAPARPAAKVAHLREWLERRAAAGRAGLAVAAAPHGEVLLFETHDAHLSFAAPDTLIVDLLSDRRPGALPVIFVSGAEIARAAEVHDAEERFTISLPAGVLDGERESAAGDTPQAAGRVVLRLPLTSGDVDIELPPPDIA